MSRRTEYDISRRTEYDRGGRGWSAPIDTHHNQPVPGQPAQWQAPHRERAQDKQDKVVRRTEPDLDLVEAAFAEGFAEASDPTSFLRLAQIPFEAVADDGAKLALLRVEVEAVTDVGSLTPHLGGGSMRFDPLPARMISRRKRLRFMYFDGTTLRPLDLAQVRALVPVRR
jgi:hypothetical protein